MSTKYQGLLIIEPPLNKTERRALTAFFGSRRIQTTGGPLDSRRLPQSHPEVISYNEPPEGQPSLYCDLEVSEDGRSLMWGGDNGTENLELWIGYVIDHLLKFDAEFNIRERNYDLSQMSDDDLLRSFDFNHFVNGVLKAEQDGQTWEIYVIDNEVSVVRSELVAPVPLIVAQPGEDEEDEDLDV